MNTFFFFLKLYLLRPSDVLTGGEETIFCLLTAYFTLVNAVALCHNHMHCSWLWVGCGVSRIYINGFQTVVVQPTECNNGDMFLL